MTRILVTLGGSDPDNVTEKVIRALKRIESLNFVARVVIGGMNQHRDNLMEAIGNDARLTLVQDAPNMATEYQWADLAVSAGGGSNWEMCRMGLPRILLVIADNQVATAKACEAAATAINLGAAENVSIELLADAVVQLANDTSRLQQMSQNSLELIDGKGPDRIVAQLSLFLPGSQHKFATERDPSSPESPADELVFRAATMSDAAMLLDWRNDAKTSAASRSSEQIDLASHKNWLSGCLANYKRRLLIAEENGEPVGTVRVDVSEPDGVNSTSECELSWTVAPTARRRGVGRRMVKQVAASLGLTTKAVARASNVASQKVAVAAGFRLVSDDGEWLTFELNGH